MSNFFLHANWEQQTKESTVVDGTSCCYPFVSCDVNSLHHVTSITPNKMADNDMSFRQRAVIEFLVKEEIPTAEIHQRLQRAYGSVCMGASSVRRWVKHFKDGKTEAIQKAVRLSSDGWNGVLPQGNFQTSRTLGEMHTRKW